ncbi:hypothetical protein NLG97_g5562 [Lecanicillium saksenae]|uniref:Uncharacterized protein n=1 Tax=Lecanicillium saksenae TaxID=468837 RepID=A0ACC1QSB0_9HYPO|nr:hypothetical protein NLG97_g5562 [Lecanicillium saksenae]
MYDTQEPFDDLVWEKNEEVANEGLRGMRMKEKVRRVEDPVKDKFGGEPSCISPLILGGFNIIYRVHVDCRIPDVVSTFGRIGGLIELPDGNIGVGDRPLTHNMTDMIGLANIPREALPPEGTTYETADSWYTALAEMHLAQLAFQHNDAIISADDCRNKYVARQIFLRLARQGRLSSFGFKEDEWSAHAASGQSEPPTCPMPSGTDSFRLWCDDLQAGNILLTETDEIAALIDWEYTYAAPTQFILDPPWTYADRIEIWLTAVREAEAALGGYDALPLPLSTYMRESWETERFFLNYAARRSWAFDVMYWTFLDEKFFGPRGGDAARVDLWKTRVALMTDAQRDALEPFVERKMAETDDRRIVDWDPAEVRLYLDKLLLD